MRERPALRGCMVALVLSLCSGAEAPDSTRKGPADTVRLRLEIEQDMNLVLFSDYGEPAQFAVWLEQADEKKPRTWFVTRRSGTGEWEGKLECPVALPRWFRVWRAETGRDRLPTPEHPAADGVSGATPKAARVTLETLVARDARYVCWVEVNLAADFNAAFPKYDEDTGRTDTHHDGQPALLYRAEFEARTGAAPEFALYGYSNPEGKAERDLSDITTARQIFSTLKLEVRSP